MSFIDIIKTKPKNMQSAEQAIASVKKDISKLGDISLGTDVEVLWLQKNELLDGTSSFKFYHADTLFSKLGLYGTDGRTIQGEWRVTPAVDVRTFIKSMEEMITLCKTYIALKQQADNNMYSIFPYGMGVYSIFKDKKMYVPESIGLHIHLGTLLKSTATMENTVAALDGLLAPVIRIFEPVLGAHIRTGCGYYGDLSDFKPKPYGFEYRTLPSCIDNKDVFAGSFALAKAIAFETRYPSGNIKNSDLVAFKVHRNSQYDKKYLRVLVKRAHIFVKNRCRFYYIYKEEIDRLFELALVKNPHKLFETHEDIFSTWDIACDFKDKNLITAMKNDAVISPRNSPIEGYINTKIKDLPKPLKEKQNTFTVNSTPW